MKRLLPLTLAFLLLPGCGTFSSVKNHIFGKASQKTEQIAAKIDKLEDLQAANNESRLTHIGAWAEGTQEALNRSTNDEPAVTVAKETNERVIALAGKPDFQELKEIYSLINTLMTNQVQGQKMLAQKDKIIIDLNKERDEERQEHDDAIQQALNQSVSNAKHADSLKAQLDDYKGWFGLKAVIKGGWQFIRTCMWALAIGGTLFFGLRIAASFYPPAAAAFGVFDQLFSFAVHGLKLISPKSFHIAGFVSSQVNDDYKIVLTKIVDAVEVVQDRATAAKTTPLVTDVMTEMEKAKLTAAQESIITTIKTTLNWK